MARTRAIHYSKSYMVIRWLGHELVRAGLGNVSGFNSCIK